MFNIILIVISIVGGYFSIRYFLLRKNLEKSAYELHNITDDLEQNRIIKLPSPQPELEELLKEINYNLESIRKARIRYEEKEKSLQKQIENISHDLRTPLTAILGFLDMIDDKVMGAEDRESLEIVKRKAWSLKKLISQFYDLSRLEADDYKLELEETDIGRLLRETAIDSYQELKMKNLEVTLDIPDKPMWVLADGDALERIFSNLLQNAGRYAHSMLAIRLFQDTGKVTVLMENDNTSLHEEELEAIFDRFYTVDTSRGKGSTGLGLPIARYLAEGMGGVLYARIRYEDDIRWMQIYLEMKRLS